MKCKNIKTVFQGQTVTKTQLTYRNEGEALKVMMKKGFFDIQNQ